MRVRWLRRALLNLDHEATYIAQDNPKAAAEFVVHLRDSALLLGEQPNLGRPGRIPGTRKLVVFNLPYTCPIGFATRPSKYFEYFIHPESGLRFSVNASRIETQLQ